MPKAVIDWELVKKLCGAQCTKDEVCARLDVDPKTLTKHLKEEYDLTWREFFQRYKLSGFASLRAKTFEKAVEDGDWNAIKHLRKHWFDEHDKMDVGFDPEKPVKFVLDMGKNLSKGEANDESKETNSKEGSEEG